MREMADTDTNTMLESVKLALAITVDSYDAELQDLINAALYDLKTNGVDALNMQTDALVVQAVKTYCGRISTLPRTMTSCFRPMRSRRAT